MKQIALAFLWHMHQPYYFNPLNGRSIMPWSRLHGTAGYFDLISILGDYPDIRQTFNLVPSLLKQIEQYNVGGVEDIFLQHSEKDASDLTPDERSFILWNFFMVNWQTRIMPYPRYKKLLYMRGNTVTEGSMDSAVKRFSERDLRDLQVWFNLAWFGHMAARQYPEIAHLRGKGSDFTEEEKKRVIDIQKEILKKIIPLYLAGLERGQIEISTSPFYHPIMPLMIDTQFARRAMPDVPLPNRFSHPEDLSAQLDAAVEQHRRIFGKRPQGLWPPEGSVSPEVVPIVSADGFDWMASDEDILFRSLRSRDRFGNLYRPYRVEHEGNSIAMVFRDRDLSDRIGFAYQKSTGKSASADFMMRLMEIATSARDREPLVCVILDGENPWQSYPDGGEGFLRSLYEAVGEGKPARTVGIGEFIKANPPSDLITRLHSGSWIDSNYGVWIGEREDNEAWNLLGKTRMDLKLREQSLDEDLLRKACDEIYAAEGSDWFWWYGDRFSTDNDLMFDELFRTHLKNVYTIIGERSPENLDVPIVNVGRVRVVQEPKAFIRPVLDGRESSYYEWVDAGRYRAARSDSTMCKTASLIRAVYYGFDEDALHLRIDPVEMEEGDSEAGCNIQVNFTKPHQCTVSFPLSPPQKGAIKFILSNPGARQRAYTTIAVDKIVELSIPFGDLGFKEKDEVCFYVRVLNDGIELERHPYAGFICFQVPDETFELRRWNAL